MSHIDTKCLVSVLLVLGTCVIEIQYVKLSTYQKTNISYTQKFGDVPVKKYVNTVYTKLEVFLLTIFNPR